MMDDSKKAYIPNIKNNAKVILLDIEGTTTPIVFVSEVLFPYAKSYVKSYLIENYDSDETMTIIKSLQDHCKTDPALDTQHAFDFAFLKLNKDKEVTIDSAVEYVNWLISNDKKITPLKELQGLIWKDAYESGKIKGDVYDDVVPALKLWKNLGKSVYIYSSGSVQAQKLLFKYSNHGNMLSLIHGHFDTKVGNKKIKDSYLKIAEFIGVPTRDILFITDVVAEADAAQAAGMVTIISCRPGNKLVENISNYTFVNDFTCLM